MNSDGKYSSLNLIECLQRLGGVRPRWLGCDFMIRVFYRADRGQFVLGNLSRCSNRRFVLLKQLEMKQHHKRLPVSLFGFRSG